jgi:tetratricopeptide (TPR) repeat protein
MKIRPYVANMTLLKTCREYYSGNKTELHNISNFADSYDEVKAIVWYTKDSFVHKLLNKALRTHDHEKLLAFRPYIKDLRRQLFETHERMRNKVTENVLHLYRGQMMHCRELEELKDNVGNLISMNGFLSTSLNQNVALIYTEHGLGRSSMLNYQSCLFEIRVNFRRSNTIFADITEYSDYPDEEEVLFDIGSTFKIASIAYDEAKGIWIIKLEDSFETTEYVNNYLQLAKKELQESNNILLFAKLMHYLGEYSKFNVYFKELSNTLPEQQHNVIQLLFKTALACEKRGKIGDALNNYTHLLDKQLNSPSIGSTYYSLAQLYAEQESYSLALANYGKALEIQSKCLPIQHPVLMETLEQIGRIREAIGNH